jgi:acyl carrier protein
MDSGMADGAKETLQRFIEQRFPLAGAKKLSDDTPLLDSGMVDSLGILDLVVFIEEKFGIVAEDHELVPENFGTIAALTRFVKDRL